MAPTLPSEKRNQFLDAGESDDDAGRGSDSDDELQKGGRSAKRRRVADDDDSEGEDFSDEEQGEDDDGDDSTLDGPSRDPATSEATTGEGKQATKSDKKAKAAQLPDISKPLNLKKNLITSDAAIKKSGVVFCSRVPPFLKPAKMRSLLEPYGTINRIFLAPEDPLSHTRRVKSGGNKKRSYTEGWIEFVRKKDAKRACELLNAQTIGGKKGTYYRDDLWNLVYLKGFKWHNLTEQIAAENAERSSRMRAEISRTTKENKEFVRNVEKGKMLDGMHIKAQAKQQKKASDGDDTAGGKPDAPAAAVAAVDGPGRERKRTFKQIPLVKKRKQDEAQPESVQRVLRKIF
ncbi:hypothetical protein B0T22DRAFT_142865 [Podospora appendiculata]|uniref:18S rRNA factor 2 n=1 Tax=Podospora appendiculata TaxID=314037 RepID=A0AAE1CC20_9PEZI|nr:hypothetical protein B0T22DRAFT_142865 [Podospora appendiculata]